MISVEDAVEELLSNGGPCVYHRQKIAELLVAQESKILELSGEKCEQVVEPPRPVRCTNCGTTYEKCTSSIFSANGKACCGTCADTATHAQDAWENWIRNGGERN